MSDKTAVQEWVRRRIDAVQEVYTTYHALTEFGVELVDELTDLQISCIFPKHGVDANPSSRFYGGPGKESRFWCYKCKEMARGISVFAQFRNLTFMEALAALEKRFGVEVPKLASGTFEGPKEKIRPLPERIDFLETKLIRVRDRLPLVDLIKFFRVLDAVNWDFEKEGRSDPAMHDILNRVESRVSELLELQLQIDSL